MVESIWYNNPLGTGFPGELGGQAAGCLLCRDPPFSLMPSLCSWRPLSGLKENRARGG